MEITTEMKSELLEILLQELEKKKQQQQENRKVYQRVSKIFDKDFKQFDYEISTNALRRSGEETTRTYTCPGGSKTRDAIGALLTVVFRSETITKLPVDKEKEIEEFVQQILKVMTKYRKQLEMLENTNKNKLGNSENYMKIVELENS
jgi:hypothetical protein